MYRKINSNSMEHVQKRHLPYYRKLTLNEIKVLEINANLLENDF